MIIDILLTMVFLWFAWQVLKLLFKAAWSLAKVIAVLLLIVSVPGLFVCLTFVGGLVLLVPLAMIGAAFGLLKCCV